MKKAVKSLPFHSHRLLLCENETANFYFANFCPKRSCYKIQGSKVLAYHLFIFRKRILSQDTRTKIFPYLPLNFNSILQHWKKCHSSMTKLNHFSLPYVSCIETFLVDCRNSFPLIRPLIAQSQEILKWNFFCKLKKFWHPQQSSDISK